MKGEEWEEGDAGIDSEGGLGGIPGIRDEISDWLNLQCDTWAWRIRLADAEWLYIWAPSNHHSAPSPAQTALFNYFICLHTIKSRSDFQCCSLVLIDTFFHQICCQ